MPTSPRDTITISKTFADSSTVINVSTSLPRSPDEPAYLRPAPPFVRADVGLLAFCVQLPQQSTSDSPSTSTHASGPSKLKLTVFWQWNPKGTWAVGSSLGYHLPTLLVNLVDSARELNSRVPLLTAYGRGVALGSTSFDVRREALSLDWRVVWETDESSSSLASPSDKEPPDPQLGNSDDRTLDFALPEGEGWRVQVTVKSLDGDDDNKPPTWAAFIGRFVHSSACDDPPLQHQPSSSNLLLRVSHPPLADPSQILRFKIAITHDTASKSIRLNGVVQPIASIPLDSSHSLSFSSTSATHKRLSRQLAGGKEGEETASLSGVSLNTIETISSVASSVDSGAGKVEATTEVAFGREGERSEKAEKSVLSLIRRNYICTFEGVLSASRDCTDQSLRSVSFLRLHLPPSRARSKVASCSRGRQGCVGPPARLDRSDPGRLPRRSRLCRCWHLGPTRSGQHERRSTGLGQVARGRDAARGRQRAQRALVVEVQGCLARRTEGQRPSEDNVQVADVDPPVLLFDGRHKSLPVHPSYQPQHHPNPSRPPRLVDRGALTKHDPGHHAGAVGSQRVDEQELHSSDDGHEYAPLCLLAYVRGERLTDSRWLWLLTALAGIGDFAIKAGGPPMITRLGYAKVLSSKFDLDKNLLRVEYQSAEWRRSKIVSGTLATGSSAPLTSLEEASLPAAKPRQSDSEHGPIPNVECELRCDTDTWASTLDIVIDPPPLTVSCLRRHRLSAGGGGCWITIEHDAVLLDKEPVLLIVKKGSPAATAKDKHVVFVNGAKIKMDVEQLPEVEVKSLAKQKRTKPARIPLDQPPAAGGTRKVSSNVLTPALPASADVQDPVRRALTATFGSMTTSPFFKSWLPIGPTPSHIVPPPPSDTAPPSPLQPAQVALNSLDSIRLLHTQWSDREFWTLVSNKDGLLVEKRIAPFVSTAHPVHRASKVLEGFSAEDVASVVSTPGTRRYWDDKSSTVIPLQAYGNGCSANFVTSRCGFPFRERGFYVASTLANISESSPSTPTAGSGPSSTALYFVQSSIPSDVLSSFDKLKVNPNDLPIGEMLVEGWVLEVSSRRPPPRRTKT